MESSKTENLQVGQPLIFTCNACYYRRGSQIRKCQADLTWSGFQPSCIRKFQLSNFPMESNECNIDFSQFLIQCMRID